MHLGAVSRGVTAPDVGTAGPQPRPTAAGRKQPRPTAAGRKQPRPTAAGRKQPTTRALASMHDKQFLRRGSQLTMVLP